VCQAVRAPGSKVTLAHETRAGAAAVFSGSSRTTPVKYSAGPFWDGWVPARFSSIVFSEIDAYTLSHLAAVLPFSRLLARLRILSAMAIGSMVPDFGYLLPIHPLRVETHSAVSLFTFSLPLGLLTYWIFQRWMKTPLFAVLPDSVYLRWRPFLAPAALNNPRQWLRGCGRRAGGCGDSSCLGRLYP